MATDTAPSFDSRAAAEKAKKKPAGVPGGKFHRYPWWAPRFWHGMTLGVWLRFAANNGFRISPSRWPMAIGVTIVSLLNTALWLLQTVLLGRRVARSKLEHSPIFIIGHWRSGTTYLHELLVLDQRFAFPTTYECFAPSHFLVSAWLVARYMKFLLPKKRPMDNMATGWDLPQEDEFALCNLGLGSPYKTMGFPNREPQDVAYLDLKELSDKKRQQWKKGFLSFLQHVAYRKPRTIVLKSPPHTARVRTLLELFPDAKFIHIVRDPVKVFMSTLRLWRSLYEVQGLQADNGHDVTEYVLFTLERMYDSFEVDRSLLKPGQYHEVRYEDLVREPARQLSEMYEALALGDFEQVRPRLEKFLAAKKNYQTNRFEAPPEIRALVAERWGEYAKRYGYGREES